MASSGLDARVQAPGSCREGAQHWRYQGPRQSPEARETDLPQVQYRQWLVEQANKISYEANLSLSRSYGNALFTGQGTCTSCSGG